MAVPRLSSSLKITERFTSMILPTGAVRTKRAFVPIAFQKDAKDFAGGRECMLAGVATLLLVSETSLLLVLAPPNHSTEQVANEPCDAGGVQIDTRLTLTVAPIALTVVLVTVPMLPAAHNNDVAVMPVAVPLVEVKR